MNQYLAWFDEIPDGELAMAAGGKGASLCRMSRAGLPVPEGFIVRSEMFNAFMEANNLWDYVFENGNCNCFPDSDHSHVCLWIFKG